MGASHKVSVDELGMASVDPESPVPLYYQVESDLRRLMDEGTLPPGATLPPEQALCGKYGVSRHTVREALSRLAAEGRISRSAGRGTFVEAQPDRMKFYLDRSFTQQMADMGRQAHSRVLEKGVGTIGEHDPDALQERHGADCFRLARLRYGDHEPIGIQHATILTAQCPELETHDFAEESLYDVLSRTYQLAITEIRHTIGAAVADEQQAELLQIATGDPMLVVHTMAFLDDRQLIEHTKSYYRADRYEYRTVHTYADV